MNGLHNALSGLRCHKKMAVTTYALFTIFLFNLIFLKSLIIRQDDEAQQFEQRWRMLKKILPQVSDQSYQELAANSQQILTQYQKLFLINCLIFFILSLLSSWYFTSKRKKEILSLRYLGAHSQQIITQNILEHLMPIFFSILTVLICLIFFQSGYNSIVNRTNQNVFTKLTTNDFTISFDNQEHDKEKSDAVLPFNEKTIFITQESKPIKSTKNLANFISSVGNLLLLTLISTGIITSGYYLYLEKKF